MLGRIHICDGSPLVLKRSVAVSTMQTGVLWACLVVWALFFFFFLAHFVCYTSRLWVMRYQVFLFNSSLFRFAPRSASSIVGLIVIVKCLCSTAPILFGDAHSASFNARAVLFHFSRAEKKKLIFTTACILVCMV